MTVDLVLASDLYFPLLKPNYVSCSFTLGNSYSFSCTCVSIFMRKLFCTVSSNECCLFQPEKEGCLV